MDEISLKNEIAIMRALHLLLRGAELIYASVPHELQHRIAISQDALKESAKHQSDTRTFPVSPEDTMTPKDNAAAQKLRKPIDIPFTRA